MVKIILSFGIIYLLLLIFKSTSDTNFTDLSALYDSSKNGVIALDARNIRQFLNYSSIPVLVEFYASWCGHCISFKKFYERLKIEIESWGIHVTAINCAFHENLDICDMYYKIEAYPTLKLASCMVDEKDQNLLDLSTISHNRDIHTIRKIIASYIANQTKCGVILHRSYNFDLTFWHDFKENLTPYRIMIIVMGKSDDKSIFDSISLDLKSCHRMFVTRIDFQQTNLTSLFGIFSGPTIIGVDTSLQIKTLTTDFDDYGKLRFELYNQYISECTGLEALKLSLNKPDEKIIEEKATTGVSFKQVNDVYLRDMISGIGMALREEIPRRPFGKEKHEMIFNFIHAIHDCVPWEQPQKDFLHDLIQWSLGEGEGLESSKWLNFMKSEQAIAAFPDTKVWIHCKGVTPTYRGFPCSLWQTFHTMTTMCEKPSANYNITSFDVLVAVRGYITNFFGCGPCREHFRELTKHVAEKVHSSEEAIIFLWNGHNSVNARLRLDDSADPTAPKIQFPSEENCPDCHNIQSLDEKDIFISTPGYGVIPIKWNYKSVLDYLRKHYGSDNIRVSSEPVKPNNEDLYDPSSEYVKKIEAV